MRLVAGREKFTPRRRVDFSFAGKSDFGGWILSLRQKLFGLDLRHMIQIQADMMHVRDP